MKWSDLSDEERESLKLFRRLPEHDQEYMLAFANKAISLPKSELDDYFKKVFEHSNTVKEIIHDLRDGDWWKLGEE